MAFNRYYQDELSYLRDLGAEFAAENPQLAGFLGRESDDPDVERLLEAFAFLTGRLRQKIDDDLPELSHSLIALLWPHYLRPVPAMSILELVPVPGAVAGRQRVAKGVMVESRPVEGTRCRFRTCFDVDLLPLAIERVEIENAVRQAQLRVTLELGEGAAFPGLGLETLRLHLATDREPQIGRTLLLWLCRHLRRVLVRGEGGRQFALGGGCVQPAGLAAEEAVLPYPSNAFAGYRLLQEYFMFPQKFMFVDVAGLAPTAGFEGRRLELVFELDRPFPEEVRIGPEHVRLNCTPIINLFPNDGQPINLDHTKTEYRVRPIGGNVAHLDTYTVESVVGWVQGRSERVVYEPFESFRHAVAPPPVGRAPAREAPAGPVYYRLRLKPAVVGRGVDLYMSFVDAREQAATPHTETVSVALTCTNGRLCDLLQPGSIDQPTASTPDFVTVRNISRVTPQVPPPVEAGLTWRLIANLARNYASFATVEALRTVIATYNFRAFFDQQAHRALELMLDSLKRVDVRPIEYLHRGLPIRGQEVRVVLEEGKLGGEGETFLFGAVLDQFLSVYASVNACHRLVVQGVERNLELTWPIRVGRNALL